MKHRYLILVPALLACGPFFYQAPPPLAVYPERIPTKAWHELLQEAQPRSDESNEALITDTRSLVEKYPTLTQEQRLENIDSLRTRNRKGEFGVSLANFLIELQEVATANTPNIQNYLTWRIENLHGIKLPTPPFKSWDMSDEDYAKKVAAYEKDLRSKLTESDQRILTASPALKPYEQVQRGGMLFRVRLFDKANDDFQAVITEHPDHPRAEVALFMSGRCALNQARAILPAQIESDPAIAEKHNELLATAEERFNNYLTAYPDGRFTGDAIGWLGGTFFDQGYLDQAITQQLRRLDHQATREVTRSVLRECDQLFAKLIMDAAEEGFWDDMYSTPGLSEEGYQLLAKHPLVARLFIQHCIDPAAQIHLPIYSENESGDRGTLEFLRKRIIAPGTFPQAALTTLGKAIAGKDLGPDPTPQLILAWAATRSGEHAQALALLSNSIDSTDETLHARAVILSRLGRHADSATTYEKLFELYPKSPLTAPSQFDYAIALQRSGQASKALSKLLELNRNLEEDSWDSSRQESLYLRPSNETAQWIDTFSQFSPIESLGKDLNEQTDPRTNFIRAILRTRAICAGDFELAAKHLDGETPPFPIYNTSETPWKPYPHLHLNQERWEKEVSLMAKTAATLKLNPNIAELHLQHARQWENMRGRLTLPLYGILDYSKSEAEKIEQLRRVNGRMLGLSDETITTELDSRDELEHALTHYLAAAELSTNPDIAAPALFSANETLFRLAEFSPYATTRAVERNHTILSQNIVARLKEEFPNRPEAKQAIVYHFELPELLGKWMPGDTTTWIADDLIEEAIIPDSQNQPSDDAQLAAQTSLTEILTILQSLQSGDDSIEDIQSKLSLSRANLDELRAFIDSITLIPIIDTFDDLIAAANTPGVTPELFRKYVGIREHLTFIPEIDDNWRPLAASLEFLDRIRPVTNPSGWDQPNNNTIESWTTYLGKYPNSPKAEAASLRLLRLQVRAACPIPHVRGFHFPESPIANGYKRLVIIDPSEDFDPEALNSALAAHRAKYPANRYDADLTLLEAAVASRAEDYQAAIHKLTSVLSNKQHPELRQDAALYFAELSLRLLDPEKRPSLVTEFIKTPRALDYLNNLANGDTCVSRVRPLLTSMRPLPR